MLKVLIGLGVITLVILFFILLSIVVDKIGKKIKSLKNQRIIKIFGKIADVSNIILTIVLIIIFITSFIGILYSIGDGILK